MNEQRLIEVFQWLHRHPELGLREYETTAYLKEILRGHGVRLLDTGLETGAIAVVSGRADGPVVGLRADIDALPIQEDTGLPYASEHPGVMHACGHDFHAACMLGVALLLKEREASLPGTVKIVFQPAEEVDDGAKSVVATGLVDDARVFYAGHTYPWLEAGTLGIRPGPVMAAPDRFAVRIRGVGSHAGHPDKGVDPIPALAAIITAAQTIVSRGVDPFDCAVVSITHVEAGNTWNVIPGEAFLEGTVRTMLPGTRDAIHERLERLVHDIARAHGCAAEWEIERGSGSVINDAAACERAAAVARELGLRVVQQPPSMGAEDFSEYLGLAPGAFIRVGTGGGIDAHQPRFTVDPAALWPAARYFAALAEAELRRLDNEPSTAIDKE